MLDASICKWSKWRVCRVQGLDPWEWSCHFLEKKAEEMFVDLRQGTKPSLDARSPCAPAEVVWIPSIPEAMRPGTWWGSGCVQLEAVGVPHLFCPSWFSLTSRGTQLFISSILSLIHSKNSNKKIRKQKAMRLASCPELRWQSWIKPSPRPQEVPSSLQSCCWGQPRSPLLGLRPAPSWRACCSAGNDTKDSAENLAVEIGSSVFICKQNLFGEVYDLPSML